MGLCLRLPFNDYTLFDTLPCGTFAPSPKPSSPLNLNTAKLAVKSGSVANF